MTITGIRSILRMCEERASWKPHVPVDPNGLYKPYLHLFPTLHRAIWMVDTYGITLNSGGLLNNNFPDFYFFIFFNYCEKNVQF